MTVKEGRSARKNGQLPGNLNKRIKIMQEFFDILTGLGNKKDVRQLADRLDRYAKVCREILPDTAITADMLYGMELLFAFATFFDRLMDESVSREDVALTVIAENKYINWLSNYDVRWLKGYLASIRTYLRYTKKECDKSEKFDYTLDNYLEKEEPFVNHLNMMFEYIEGMDQKTLDFIKKYFLVILVNDDIEDVESDYSGGRRTLVGELLRTKGLNPFCVEIKTMVYWQAIDSLFSAWLDSLLTTYKEYEPYQIYQNIRRVYDNIKFKIMD